MVGDFVVMADAAWHFALSATVARWITKLFSRARHETLALQQITVGKLSRPHRRAAWPDAEDTPRADATRPTT